MKFVLLFALLFMFCYSCSSGKDTIIDSETGAKTVGYSRDCRFQIGKTPKKQLSVEQLKICEKDSLYLVFQYASFGQKSDKLVAGWAGGKYVTSKGVRTGDSVEKAQNIYGKPKATILEYWKDGNIHWMFHGLFYPNLVVLTDSSFTKVLGVAVGEQFPLDEKYIKKH